MIRRVRPPFLAAAAILCGALAPAAGAPVPGYLDPKTNAFTPLPFLTDPAPAAEADDGIAREGTLVVVVKLAVDPATPAGATFFASAQSQTQDAVFTSSVAAAGSVPTSGGAGTLRLKMPYTLTVSSAATKVAVSLSLYSSTGAYLTTVQSIPLPANGATTTVVFNEKI